MPETTSVPVLRCTSCGRLDPGPRDLCATCHTATLEKADVPGSGRLVSWTFVRRPPAAFRDEGQYAVAIVKLDAGVQVTGRLASPGEEVKPGTRVHVVGTQRGVAVFAADQKAA